MSSDQRQYGLDQSVIHKIHSVLSDFPQISSALLYGSRAKGNFRNGSDIDLTLKTDGDDSLRLLTGVMDALDDLDLIYRFDVSLLSQIKNESLLEHIERVGVEFYNAKMDFPAR
ncbi:MAG: nucleotidyltransferase domain-containing protein [Gammaproteobacteria bacterium]|nr:nucleotidyltransferase domain-containing protein [Gammaproteobacteria bacterium]